jgi:DNA helicase II / ATP-dependent DNA helicase PcrA
MAMTPHQYKAANHTEGNAKVLAGAGSGKSATLIARIENLINKGCAPENILVVMFGADPAEQFKARLVKRLNTKNVPPVLTFHRLGGQFLIAALTKEKLIPYAKLEASEFKLKKMCISVLSKYLPTTQQQYAVVHDFMSFIDLVKGTLLKTPAEVFTAYEFKSENSFFIDGFKHFEKLRKHEN